MLWGVDTSARATVLEACPPSGRTTVICTLTGHRSFAKTSGTFDAPPLMTT
jgi:hypothetical protein